MALLEAQGLSVHFGGLSAVKGVTFGIEPGERLALIGPNGAGKTTLFNLLTGQLKPSSGKVLLKGQDITNASVYTRTHLGMARSFQITSLFPYQSTLVNAMIGLQGVEKSRYGFFRPFFKDRLSRRPPKNCSSPRTYGTSGTRSSARWRMGSNESWRSP